MDWINSLLSEEDNVSSVRVILIAVWVLSIGFGGYKMFAGTLTDIDVDFLLGALVIANSSKVVSKFSEVRKVRRKDLVE